MKELNSGNDLHDGYMASSPGYTGHGASARATGQRQSLAFLWGPFINTTLRGLSLRTARLCHVSLLLYHRGARVSSV